MTEQDANTARPGLAFVPVGNIGTASSGNRGHAGRPGERGGSGEGAGSDKSEKKWVKPVVTIAVPGYDRNAPVPGDDKTLPEYEGNRILGQPTEVQIYYDASLRLWYTEVHGIDTNGDKGPLDMQEIKDFHGTDLTSGSTIEFFQEISGNRDNAMTAAKGIGTHFNIPINVLVNGKISQTITSHMKKGA